MAHEVKKDSTPTLEFYPTGAAGALSAASAAVYSPGGTLLATIPGSVDSTSDAVVSAANDAEITVGDASDFVAGRQYLLLCDAGPEVVTVQRVNAADDVLYLAQRTSDSPRAGNAILGLRCAAALSAPCTADLGVNYRIEWTIEPSSGDDLHGQTMYHVVAMPLGRLVTVPMVIGILKQFSEESPDRYGAVIVRQIADGAERRLRELIEAVARYPHKYGDPAQFASAAIQATKLELAVTHGMVPPGFAEGPARWEYECRRNLDRDFGTAVRQLGWYDAEDSREPDVAPAPAIFAARIRL